MTAVATMTMLGYDDLPELLTRLTGDEKHDWSSLSTLDVLWVLHDRVLEPDDRFLLSKGHGPAAFYAVLAAKGLCELPCKGSSVMGVANEDFHVPLHSAPRVQYPCRTNILPESEETSPEVGVRQ